MKKEDKKFNINIEVIPNLDDINSEYEFDQLKDYIITKIKVSLDNLKDDLIEINNINVNGI